MKTGYMMMLALVSAGLTGCSYTTNKSFVQLAPPVMTKEVFVQVDPPVTIVDIPSPPPPVRVQTQIQLQPTSQSTLVVVTDSRPQNRPQKLMLYLFCPVCQEYYTWKGGVLPLNTQLYFWHPVAKEWRIYGGDYRKIMRPDHSGTDERCPNHRRR
jgi:ribosomal protein L33